MKFLVVVLSLMGVAYARPDVSELSGSYLPGVSGGSNILSTNIGGNYNSPIGDIGKISGYMQSGYFPNFQDQRHVFFYAAPDDEAPARFRVNIAPSSHRNTKIIFVKTPSYGGVIPEVIAPPSQAEDKTLVYVLVKKQQHGGSVTIPSSLGVKQAKPQVFFVKYRNQQDAQQAVYGGLNGQGVGAGLSDLGNEGSFIRTLNTGFGGTGGGIILNSGNTGGSSILGTSTGGTGGVFGTGIDSGIRYGTAGASGPYKR